MGEEKICPIRVLGFQRQYYGTQASYDQAIERESACLGDRCAWWAEDRCFVAGACLASAVVVNAVEQIRLTGIRVVHENEDGPHV